MRGKQELVLNKLPKIQVMKASKPQFQELMNPPSRRTSQKRGKAARWKRLSARYHENASFIYAFHEILVLPPPLALPGTVNIKLQSPAPCARQTG